MLCEIEKPKLFNYKQLFDTCKLVLMGPSIETNIIEYAVESNNYLRFLNSNTISAMDRDVYISFCMVYLYCLLSRLPTKTLYTGIQCNKLKFLAMTQFFRGLQRFINSLWTSSYATKWRVSKIRYYQELQQWKVKVGKVYTCS